MKNSSTNYEPFKKASDDIINSAHELSKKEVFYFLKDDKYLSDYVNSLKKLRKAVTNYNNLFYEFEMELIQLDYEQWEETQRNIEQEYYNEVV